MSASRIRLFVVCLAGCALLPAGVAWAASTPRVVAVSPLHLGVGETLTVRGTNFLAGKNRNWVVFQRARARAVFVRVDTATSTKLTFVVPTKLLPFLTRRGGTSVPTRFSLRCSRGASLSSRRRGGSRRSSDRRRWAITAQVPSPQVSVWPCTQNDTTSRIKGRKGAGASVSRTSHGHAQQSGKPLVDEQALAPAHQGSQPRRSGSAASPRSHSGSLPSRRRGDRGRRTVGPAFARPTKDLHRVVDDTHAGANVQLLVAAQRPATGTAHFVFAFPRVRTNEYPTKLPGRCTPTATRQSSSGISWFGRGRDRRVCPAVRLTPVAPYDVVGIRDFTRGRSRRVRRRCPRHWSGVRLVGSPRRSRPTANATRSRVASAADRPRPGSMTAVISAPDAVPRLSDASGRSSAMGAGL